MLCACRSGSDPFVADEDVVPGGKARAEGDRLADGDLRGLLQFAGLGGARGVARVGRKLIHGDVGPDEHERMDDGAAVARGERNGSFSSTWPISAALPGSSRFAGSAS